MLFWYKRDLHDNNGREECRGYVDTTYQTVGECIATLPHYHIKKNPFNSILYICAIAQIQ
jgi:hypothetical protein